MNTTLITEPPVPNIIAHQQPVPILSARFNGGISQLERINENLRQLTFQPPRPSLAYIAEWVGLYICGPSHPLWRGTLGNPDLYQKPTSMTFQAGQRKLPSRLSLWQSKGADPIFVAESPDGTLLTQLRFAIEAFFPTSGVSVRRDTLTVGGHRSTFSHRA